MTIKVTLSGAMGRMGRRVGAELNAMDGVMFVCGLVRGSCVSTKECLAPLTDDALAAVRSCDVLMDFTNIDSTLKLARICAELKRPIFVGTTTRRAKDIEMLKEIATDIPVLYAPNITRGAAALFGVLQELAHRLGPIYDTKVLGIHHRDKKETPSGTSSEMARCIQEGRGDDILPEISTVLAGGAYGTHEALFAGHNDEIRVVHTVTRPDIDGCVLSAGLEWLMAKPAGFFGISEVLAK